MRTDSAFVADGVAWRGVFTWAVDDVVFPQWWCGVWLFVRVLQIRCKVCLTVWLPLQLLPPPGGEPPFSLNIKISPPTKTTIACTSSCSLRNLISVYQDERPIINRKMGLTAMLVGSISGTGMHMMNNALQKVPLSRRESLSENIYYLDFCSLLNHRSGLLSLFDVVKIDDNF